MNPGLAAIAPSMIRDLHGRKRPSSLDLGLGEPTLRPELELFEAATRWVAEHGCPYSPNAGFPELREAIAAHYRYPYLATPASVCVTHGSQEALYLAIKGLLDPARDEVLVVEPSYPLYPKLCALEGIAHRTVALDPLDGFRPHAEAVLAALGPHTRMLVLGSPANPTGRVWSALELETLARGLLERPGPPIWVLWDEVYRELSYVPCASMATRYPHTIVVNSLSKSHALTGLRLGWLMAPAEIMPALVKVHQFLTTAASSFGQIVARELFTRPQGLQVPLASYQEARARTLALLRDLGLPHLVPEGGFYVMLQLPGEASDSIELAYRLLAEQDVVMIPGRAFGAAAEGWLRASWVAPESVLEAGLRRLAGVLAT